MAFDHKAGCFSDPMERATAELLTSLGIRWERDDHRSGLDFYLPDYGLYIEVKQFHSERSGEQLSRRKNVILIQGMDAIAALAKLFEHTKLNGPVRSDRKFIPDPLGKEIPPP